VQEVGLSPRSERTTFREALAGLEARVGEALRRARREGRPVLLSVTRRAARPWDPSQVVMSNRRHGEPWFCFEQPDRRGAALGALGQIRVVSAAGPDRFRTVAREWGRIVGSALADPPGRVPGSGLVAVGGFAFSAGGGGSPRWHGFDASSLIVPELSLARQEGETWITVNVECAPDDTAGELVSRAQARLDWSGGELPLLDPAPSGRYDVVSVMPPAHYEQAVAQAVARIRAGELSKVVLAREVEVHAPRVHDPAAVLGVLREAFGSCYVFAVGRGEACFLAASPELLIRREGQRASTVALAGSIRRSADPAVDDHLGEQLMSSAKDREENRIVARRIARILRPHSLWVSAAGDPGLVRVANIQHLGLPIRAQLRNPLDAVTLAGLLHPTPAVGGEPWAVARDLIPALEGMDRGWYAGPVGWTDSSGDGEFCVALRCALLRDALATCFAGAGIVRDSDPAGELAETEVKLEALLPLLAG
jgi:salicylate biosynthesis isochorismate synthase/menaquinone-specific isochorismate synthase